MRISRKLAAIAAFFVVGAVVAGCGSSIPGNSVATVAGNPITLQAFNHWMYVAAKDQVAQAAAQGATQPVVVANDPPDFKSCIKQVRVQFPQLAKSPASTLQTDCKQVFTQYTNEVMPYLIEGYWWQADAYKLGIKAPTDGKGFAKYLKKNFPTKTALANYYKQSGQTRKDLLFGYRVGTLYQKLLKRYEKPVTKSAIAAYYAAHKSNYGTPETRDVHLVRTKSKAQAQAALNALNSGQSWNTVAKNYAEDASSKANGGLLQGITSGQEEAAVNKAIFGNPVNKIVGPIQGIFGWYVLEVTKITPAVQEPLAKATPAIKATLTQTQQANAQKKILAYSKKQWFKKTTCRGPYQVQTVCSNYVAPKTTTAPITPPPATTPTTSTTASTPTKSSKSSTVTATTATTTTK